MGYISCAWLTDPFIKHTDPNGPLIYKCITTERNRETTHTVQHWPWLKDLLSKSQEEEKKKEEKGENESLGRKVWESEIAAEAKEVTLVHWHVEHIF